MATVLLLWSSTFFLSVLFLMLVCPFWGERTRLYEVLETLCTTIIWFLVLFALFKTTKHSADVFLILVLTIQNYFRAYQYIYTLWAAFSIDVPLYLWIYTLIHNFINQLFSTMSSNSWQRSYWYWFQVDSASIIPYCENWSLYSSPLLPIFLPVMNSKDLLFCIMANWLMGR